MGRSHAGAGHGHDSQQVPQPREVGRIDREERQILGYRYRRDHQAHGAAARFPACADDRSSNLAIGTCRLHTERNRVEPVLGPPQDVEPTGALHMLLIACCSLAGRTSRGPADNKPRLLHAVLRLGQRAGRRVRQPDQPQALRPERLRELVGP
jgi:hypothetical protein